MESYGRQTSSLEHSTLNEMKHLLGLLLELIFVTKFGIGVSFTVSFPGKFGGKSFPSSL